VRRGYDAVSVRYDQEYGGEAKYSAWLSELSERIPQGGAVLDLGCGSGLPVARNLSAAGFLVTGVDFSEVQIRRARELVPTAEFLRADISDVGFGAESFDAVVSFFALIHLPLDEQSSLLHRIAGWLRPGGVFVATAGYWAWTGYEDNWLGGGAPMWWSQADLASYRAWICQAGLLIDREEFVPEGEAAMRCSGRRDRIKQTRGRRAELSSRLPKRSPQAASTGGPKGPDPFEPVAQPVFLGLQVVAGLQVDPEPLGSAEESCQSQRCVCCDSPLAVHNLIDAPGWHPDFLGQQVLAHPERLEELFQQDLTRVHRRHDGLGCHGSSFR
jgi:2-polyprenyl-3-methyl-5-hydroxy-6-metoxy-1,4-benzoquinol methylase